METLFEVYPEHVMDGHRQMCMTAQTPVEIGFVGTIREDKDTLGWFAQTDFYQPWIGPFATFEDVRDALTAHHVEFLAWRASA